MAANEKPAKNINQLFKDIPLQHVTAFNNISCLSYMGAAVGHVDADDPSLQFLLIAKDVATLDRIAKHLGLSCDLTKAKGVGVTPATHLRVIPYAQASDHLMSRTYPDPMASAKPAPQAAPDDEDW